MRGNGFGRDLPAGRRDGALWQRSNLVVVPENESERFLDLAGFADGRLDPDDRDRVAEWLRDDSIAAGDVAAARALTDATAEAAPQSVVERASALADQRAGGPAAVIPFPQPARHDFGLGGVARWGSLAAAIVVVGWLGFAMGIDTSRAVVQLRQASDDGFLQELFDPAVGFMRDLTEGQRT